MSSKGSKGPNARFISEFQFFLKNYLLRLLGFSGVVLLPAAGPARVSTAGIEQDGAENTIYFCAGGSRVFQLAANQPLSDDSLSLARRIIQSFIQISENKVTESRKNIRYVSNIQKLSAYDAAVQTGICCWVIGDKEPETTENIQRFFKILETWSVKTYEGRKVTLGFIIDPGAVAKIENSEWLNFLEDDYAAVLTDCIHTVIELDRDCNFVRYRSVTEGEQIPLCPLSDQIPLRFMQVIQQYVQGTKRIGVFLLNNGDILLAKNQSVCFVKRNLQWLNLSYNAFYNALSTFLQEPVPDELVKSIFASVLDVSFSHTGGIISIVGSDRWDSDKDKILSPYDNLLGKFPESGDQSENDEKKRSLKRQVLESLVQGRSFPQLDRKMRGELIALDGACILDRAGRVYSFGAIIQNDSGSTGGGRGAAAKKLSKYGMAVKISTDGYIELYIDGKQRYAIK